MSKFIAPDWMMAIFWFSRSSGGLLFFAANQVNFGNISNSVDSTQLDEKPFGKNIERLSPYRAKTYVVKEKVQTRKRLPVPLNPL
jgi:hypothetical protein